MAHSEENLFYLVEYLWKSGVEFADLDPGPNGYPQETATVWIYIRFSD